MEERGTETFYREQAERLTRIAAEASSPSTRLELLEIAASFQRLADYVSANNAAERVGQRPRMNPDRSRSKA
jgi:hypothetical protein